MKSGFFIVSLCIGVLLASCSKKNEEEKLAGSWEMVFLLASEQGQDVVWTFHEDYSLSITETLTDTAYVHSGSYVVNKDFPGTFYVDLSGLGIIMGQELNGRYQIIRLTKTILVIQRVSMVSGKEEGAYLWKEFIKKSE